MASVAELAYAQWEARGRPAGDDWADWFAAERQLLATAPSRSAPTIPVTPALVRTWIEWAAYVASPTQETLQRLHLRAGSVGRQAIMRLMEAEVATGSSWRIAQHVSLHHRVDGRLTEAWYFAHLAVVRSNGDVRANIALAQVCEAKRLPRAVLPLLQTVRIQLRRLPRHDRRRFQTYVAEAFVRTSAYLHDVEGVSRWWPYLRRLGHAEVGTLIQALFALFRAPHLPAAKEVASALALRTDLGPRVSVRVIGVLRAHLVGLLRARP